MLPVKRSETLLSAMAGALAPTLPVFAAITVAMTVERVR